LFVSTTDKVAVIKARLPYIDRRALSEAWYSALHVAGNGGLRVPARRASDAARDERPVTLTAEALEPMSGAETAAIRARAGSPASQTAPGESTALVRARRQSARGLAFQRARSYPPFNATLTLGLDGARVQILLRRDGPALRVIALCSERHVELVRRALACADRYLREQGEVVVSDVRASQSRTQA
jgi:hypothetical protein